MTVNQIIEGIGAALDMEFNADGDRYMIRANELKQGLKEPCFFISCINPSFTLFRDNRYRRKNGFCIQYFPEDEGREKEECNDIAERLLLILRYITVNGDPVMGTGMRYECVDGILNFFVNYDCFVCIEKDGLSLMETLKQITAEKGQVVNDGSQEAGN